MDVPLEPAAPAPRVVIFVCSGCRREAAPGARVGPALLSALSRACDDPAIALRPVSCLSACAGGPNVALVAPAGWSYVFGGLNLDAVDDILTGARLIAADPHGGLPLRGRPAALKAGLIARIPSFLHSESER